MQNFGATIESQYDASPVINALIAQLNAALDPAADNTLFYNFIWNVATAQGYGLDVWGRIVGVQRIIQVASSNFFGFKEQVGDQPFGAGGTGVFYAGTPGATAYSLPDNVFRLLIYAKALANISNCSIQTYNTILRQLFPGRGNAYVTDTGNMTERLTFEFPLQPFELSILKQSNSFAPPTGVGFVILQAPQPFTFGFKEAGYSSVPFGQGTFFAGFS